MSARNQVTDQELGNCAVDIAQFDPSTGTALFLTTVRPSGSHVPGQACPLAGTLVRQVGYTHDHLLNLERQAKNFPGGQADETYSYDDLQRILTARRSWIGAGLPPAAIEDSYNYDDLGNIRQKSDYAPAYSYEETNPSCPDRPLAGPHAVASIVKNDGTTASFCYDANGNLVSGDGRGVAFDDLDRPIHVTHEGFTTSFSYAPDGARYRQTTTGPTTPQFGPKTVYYLDKDYELVVWNGAAVTEEKTYVGGSVVLYRRASTPREVRYLHVDRLGSVDAVTSTTTDATGAESTVELSVDAHGYSPFGGPRAREWTASDDRLHPGGDLGATTERGFTGHEHLDGSYLIHMNGRVYDYRLGRFLSVDPIISNPLDSQAINPYSYIGNNPLSGVDPTGYQACKSGEGSPITRVCQEAGVEKSARQAEFYRPRATVTNSGAEEQTKQIANASPGEVEIPPRVAKRLDGVLLAQAGGPKGGGAGTPLPRSQQLEMLYEQARSEIRGRGGRYDTIEPAEGKARTEEDVARVQAVARAGRSANASFAPAGPVNPQTGLPEGAHLPEYVPDAKTVGVLRTPTGDLRLQSGWDGPATSVPKGTSGFDIVTRTHVEGHAAAAMRHAGTPEATLIINNPKVCSSCESLLPRMLPPGTRLHVVTPSGSQTFVGSQR